MNFGVIGTANIARHAVVPAIGDTDHEVLAVGSREEGRARAFAEERGIERAYGSYGELLADPDLDAVYNPLPNSLHAEWTERAADEGLDVLCEKPLAVDADQARHMGEYCQQRGVTLMEAFMCRYHPRDARDGPRRRRSRAGDPDSLLNGMEIEPWYFLPEPPIGTYDGRQLMDERTSGPGENGRRPGVGSGGRASTRTGDRGGG